jgi:hypothetical protein
MFVTLQSESDHLVQWERISSVGSMHSRNAFSIGRRELKPDRSRPKIGGGETRSPACAILGMKGLSTVKETQTSSERSCHETPLF